MVKDELFPKVNPEITQGIFLSVLYTTPFLISLKSL